MRWIRHLFFLWLWASIGLTVGGLGCGSGGGSPECASDFDCLDDETCVGGECVFGAEPCTADIDCEAGDSCLNGFCVSD